jgi:non-homologous end joining protein Ku
MAARLAVEIAGTPVSLALYPRVKKQRNESFRTIAPSGQPMKSGKPIDSGTGETYDSSLSRKGVETTKGVFFVMTEEALEQINSGVKTTYAEADQFAPVETIAWDLAIDRFAVRPDDRVEGSEGSVTTLWNGLRGTGLAYVTQVSLSGSMDGILAIYATDNGLWAALLPFEEELYDVPTFHFEENDQVADLLQAVIEQQYEDKLVARFDHSVFTSEYKARRKAAIDAVVAGKKVDVQTAPQAKSTTPDLMAILKAAAAPAPKPKSTKKTKAIA